MRCRNADADLMGDQKAKFENQARMLHLECAKRKRSRPKQIRGRVNVNTKEMLYLAKQYAIADGEPIDSDADIEILATCGTRCTHIIITTDGDMWVNGWMVAAVIEPSKIHRVNQHASLSSEAIHHLFKKFERMKNC